MDVLKLCIHRAFVARFWTTLAGMTISLATHPVGYEAAGIETPPALHSNVDIN